MDHALCIIHHVIGSLSDSTPCRRYRVPRHSTAWHGLVKHKHRETINKRNVARMPRHVLALPLKPNGGKMSPSLSPFPTHSLSFSLSATSFRIRSSLSYSHIVLVATFRSDSVSLLVYEGNAIRPRPRQRRRGFFPISRAPSKRKTEPPLFDSTPRPITYAYTLRNPYGDTATCSSDITPNCLAYL